MDLVQRLTNLCTCPGQTPAGDAQPDDWLISTEVASVSEVTDEVHRLLPQYQDKAK